MSSVNDSCCNNNSGGPVIMSAAYFETAVAVYLSSQSQLIDGLICRRECTEKILKVNKHIELVIVYLIILEYLIISKIKLGMEL